MDALLAAWMRLSTITLALVIGVLGVLTITTQDASAAKLKRWHSNGYVCHKHSKPVRIKANGHRVWPKAGTRSRVHCIKPKPHRRHRAHRVGSGGWVLPAYIVRCESGGNPRAVNYSNPNRPAGLYQIISSTWAGYGGRAFAPTADLATVREQGIVALRVVRGQGMGAWECA